MADEKPEGAPKSKSKMGMKSLFKKSVKKIAMVQKVVKAFDPEEPEFMKSEYQVQTPANDQLVAIDYSNPKGRADAVKTALADGAKPLYYSKGTTALHLAVKANAADAAKLLLEAYAHADHGGPFGLRHAFNCKSISSQETLLVTACGMGAKDTIEMLLSKGASRLECNAVDTLGNSCLALCAKANDAAECILLLLKAGGKPKVANKQGLTPLHLALLGGGTVMEKCIALGSLLDAGADVNAQDNSGKTVLMEACEEPREMLELLIDQYGADTTIKNKYDQTAADMYLEGHPELEDTIAAESQDGADGGGSDNGSVGSATRGSMTGGTPRGSLAGGNRFALGRRSSSMREMVNQALEIYELLKTPPVQEPEPPPDLNAWSSSPASLKGARLRRASSGDFLGDGGGKGGGAARRATRSGSGDFRNRASSGEYKYRARQGSGDFTPNGEPPGGAASIKVLTSSGAKVTTFATRNDSIAEAPNEPFSP